MTLSAGDSFITVKSFDPAEVLVRKFEYSVSINALSGQPIIERNGRRSALRSTPLVFLVNPIKGLNQHYAIKEMEEHTDEDFTEESDSTPARMIVRASES